MLNIKKKKITITSNAGKVFFKNDASQKTEVKVQ